jgi:hypothetical protein
VAPPFEFAFDAVMMALAKQTEVVDVEHRAAVGDGDYVMASESAAALHLMMLMKDLRAATTR